VTSRSCSQQKSPTVELVEHTTVYAPSMKYTHNAHVCYTFIDSNALNRPTCIWCGFIVAFDKISNDIKRITRSICSSKASLILTQCQCVLLKLLFHHCALYWLALLCLRALKPILPRELFPQISSKSVHDCFKTMLINRRTERNTKSGVLLQEVIT